MSTNTQSNSDNDENMVFSNTVHKLMIVINAASIGLLQVVVTNQSLASITAADRHVTILCFFIFLLIFAVLRVFEVKLQIKPPLGQFLGYVSHLFGGLAALMIISNVSTAFTLLVAAPLWLIWFFVIMYISFAKPLISDDTRSTDVPQYQLSPV